jgi:hypothetical protein
MAPLPHVRSVAWIAAAATSVAVGLGALSRTARPEEEAAFSVAVESSDRNRTVLQITHRGDVDVRDLHLLPYENPQQNPPRQLPGIRRKDLVLGGAVFELVASPEAGILSFLKKPDQPKTASGTDRVELDWAYPAGTEVGDYIGMQVVLTTNRDATRWTPADIVGGRSVRIDPRSRIPALVPAWIETEHYRLSAPAGLDADVAAMRAALDHGIAALEQQFAPLDVAGLLSKATVSVQLHARPTDQAGVGHASTESGTRDGTVATYHAAIHLLAPSAHPGDARTAAGEPMDVAYCKRTLVHEYGTVLLDLLGRSKARGWQFFDAPPWFVQGYEEYLGLTCADEHAGKVTLGKYIAMVQAHPEWVSSDFGLDVTHPYVAGPVLIHFLHERYGGDKVRAILTSQEPTFGRAIRASLEVGVDRLGADWTAWLEKAAPPR